MRLTNFSFGTIQIDGDTYEHDIVIDRGEIRKRKKSPSQKFRDQFGHTPISLEEKIPWKCKRLIIGTPRNWSRNVLLWNLAADPSFGGSGRARDPGAGSPTEAMRANSPQ